MVGSSIKSFAACSGEFVVSAFANLVSTFSPLALIGCWRPIIPDKPALFVTLSLTAYWNPNISVIPRESGPGCTLYFLVFLPKLLISFFPQDARGGVKRPVENV